MHIRPKTMPGAALLALLMTGLPAIHAQNVTPPAADNKAETEDVIMLSEYIVTTSSLRESMINAQEKKREKLEITDSIVADDINKLPDLSVTEALQRITGVQIGRDRGEGSSVAIRGLSQIESLLNGREVFTAGSGRTLNMADIPAETIGGLDVYKTTSANIIEGGLGGTVDVRTRRPFDFKGMEMVFSTRGIYGDLVDDENYQYSALLSNRWKVGGGEVGLLINATQQTRSWREDAKSTGTWYARTLADGSSVVAPNGSYETASYGNRKRQGLNLFLQWRPTPELELYAEGSFAQFTTIQDTYGISMTANSATLDSYTLFPNSRDISTATFSNASFTTLSFVRNTIDKNRLAAIGAKWNRNALTVKTDLSYTDSFNNLYYTGVNLTGKVATFSQDLRDSVPSTTTSGTDLLNPSTYRYATLAYRIVPYNGDMKAAQTDAEYKLKRGPFTSLLAGLRYAERHADNEPGFASGDASVSGEVSAMSMYVKPTPITDYFTTGYNGTSIARYLNGNLDYTRSNADMVALRNAFGITRPLPTGASSALSLWSVDEDTSTAYVMGKFAGRAGLDFDGSMGVRLIRTSESVSGAQTDVATGGVKPIKIDASYNDVLPSINTRLKIQENLFLRLAASKAVTRPNFSQLSPSLTLRPNPTNPAQNAGSAGNPELKPMRAENFDLSLEKYFSRSASVYLALFYKDVNGFVGSAIQDEVVDGVTYAISRPYNTGQGRVQGYEFGYQQFYDFLPGWLSGFGSQVNYTYVDSSTASAVLGRNVPLEGLSKKSYNVILMYEHGKLATRLAYNWRDTYFAGSVNLTGIGAVPNYSDAYGWLDASISYDISKRIRVTLEGANLLNTVRKTYYEVEQRHNTSTVNDLQIIGSLTVRF